MKSSLVRQACSKNCKLVIFDMDGTLYPDNHEIIKCYHIAASQMVSAIENIDYFQAEKRLEEVKKEISASINGRPTSTLALLKHWQADFKEYEVLVNKLQMIEKNLQVDTRALEILKKIKKNKKIHLFTTNNATSSRRILKAIGMDDIFSENLRFTVSHTWAMNDISFDNRLRFIKPGPSGFDHILGIHKIAPENAIMVGDSLVSDIEPALKKGMGAYEIKNMDCLYQLAEFLEI